MRPDRLPRPDRPRQRDRSTLPYGPALQDRPTHPALPALPADPPPPRRDPPLQETPFTHPRLRSGDATATVPSLPVIPPAGPPVRRRPTPSGPPAGRRSALPGPRTAPADEAREWAGAGIRIMDALAWAGARAGNTATKILIILVAGVAGTLTGMNLLAPAIGAGTPESSLRSSAVRESASHDGSVPWNELAGRLRIPAVVTLDEFGRGSVILTVTEGSLTWRISAPGLTVTPSAGTSRAGRTEVIALRAHRIRHWCGTPSTATAPLTVHGPGGSITTTVRWRTC